MFTAFNYGHNVVKAKRPTTQTLATAVNAGCFVAGDYRITYGALKMRGAVGGPIFGHGDLPKLRGSLPEKYLRVNSVGHVSAEHYNVPRLVKKKRVYRIKIARNN